MDVFGTSISAVGSGVLVNIVRNELPPFNVFLDWTHPFYSGVYDSDEIKKHSFIVGSASFVKHKCDNSYDNKNDDNNHSDSTLVASLCICCFDNIIWSAITTVRSTITIVLAFCGCTFSCCRFWGSSENAICYDNIYKLYKLYYITYSIYYFICLSDLRDNFSGIGIDLNKVGIVILLSSSILINTFESYFLTIIDVHQCTRWSKINWKRFTTRIGVIFNSQLNCNLTYNLS